MSLFLNLLFETDSYSNEYLLAKFGFDTAENESLKVCLISRERVSQSLFNFIFYVVFAIYSFDALEVRLLTSKSSRRPSAGSST